MSGMQTTCPSCQTVFRVTAEQLQVRAGKVRCGKCAFVFNAFDTLVTPIETVSLMAEPEQAPPVEEHITLKPAPLTMAEPLTASFPLPTDEQIDEEAEAIKRSIAETEQERALRPQRPREERPARTDRSTLEITPELQEKLHDLQQELHAQEKRARWRRLGWGLGILALALSLAGQLVYFKRDFIVARYPEVRPALEALCALARCEIGLAADADRIRLEASELQVDPARPGGVVLNASLRNLAPWPQAWPHLELTLTDGAGRVVSRRHFLPQEYLPLGTSPRAGIAAGEEVPVKLSLELVGIEAAGYKLFVYYP